MMTPPAPAEYEIRIHHGSVFCSAGLMREELARFRKNWLGYGDASTQWKWRRPDLTEGAGSLLH
jgi:hypothetical protein